MNKVFAEHVTNTAFFLSVSKKQVLYLLNMKAHPHPDRRYYDRHEILKPDNFIASYGALQRKGLIERVIDDPVRNLGYYKLTRAGELCCELFAEAGFSLPMESKEQAA